MNNKDIIHFPAEDVLGGPDAEEVLIFSNTLTKTNGNI